MTYFAPELAAKRLELLKEVNAGLTRVGVLFNPANPSKEPVLSAMKQTADALKLELAEFPVREVADLDGAFASMAAKPVSAVVLTEDPLLIYNADDAARLALKYRLASCGFIEFAKAGGFLGYGIDYVETWRYAATFVDKILKGAAPTELPVERATKFAAVVNLQTAKAIGIDVPTSLLLRADEVIE
jgi:putative ABC transport system substrate-binding protein